MRWTRKSIVAAIQKLHARRVELNYVTAEAENLNLVRAAAWHFGTWRLAVEAAGIQYESIRKYRHWSRDRIVERIREHHRDGADLSWRSVSTTLDPPLAAAALRANGFSNWPEAIAAAGLDIKDVARYQSWTPERVLHEIKRLHRAKAPLSSRVVQKNNQPLFGAARRRFGSWDEALSQAGLSVASIRLRRASEGSGGNAAAAILAARPGKPQVSVKAADSPEKRQTRAPRSPKMTTQPGPQEKTRPRPATVKAQPKASAKTAKAKATVRLPRAAATSTHKPATEAVVRKPAKTTARSSSAKPATVAAKSGSKNADKTPAPPTRKAAAKVAPSVVKKPTTATLPVARKVLPPTSARSGRAAAKALASPPKPTSKAARRTANDSRRPQRHAADPWVINVDEDIENANWISNLQKLRKQKRSGKAPAKEKAT